MPSLILNCLKTDQKNIAVTLTARSFSPLLFALPDNNAASQCHTPLSHSYKSNNGKTPVRPKLLQQSRLLNNPAVQSNSCKGKKAGQGTNHLLASVLQTCSFESTNSAPNASRDRADSKKVLYPKMSEFVSKLVIKAT